MRYLQNILPLAACLVLATSLQAATSSAPLNVSADVPSNCVIATSNLAFGQYDPLVQNATQELDAAAEVTMVCTRSSRAAVSIAWQSETGTGHVPKVDQRMTIEIAQRSAGRTRMPGNKSKLILPT